MNRQRIAVVVVYLCLVSIAGVSANENLRVLPETIDGVTLVGDVWTFTTGLPVCDPGLTADVNDDCVVDMEDFAVLADDWLTGVE